MTTTFTILGCGSSMGVPRVALGWGACDPNNPKNRRRRCSLLVERQGADGRKTTVLVDTSPDLRAQLLDAQVQSVDAVLFTHEHADHIHGIDDLRPLFIRQKRRVDVYLDEATAKTVHQRFAYCFSTPPGSEYPPILSDRRVVPGELLTISGPGGPIEVLPYLQDHGDISSVGYRFGDMAYSVDLKNLPAASVAALAGLEVWVVDALRYAPHPSHFSLDEALSWIDRIRPRRTVLTNLHSDLDYEELRRKLPAHVEPAYDGLQFSTG